MIAKVPKQGFARIAHTESSPVVGNDDVPVEQLLTNGETTRIEFRSTLRVNLHTGQPDKKMEHSCLHHGFASCTDR